MENNLSPNVHFSRPSSVGNIGIGWPEDWDWGRAGLVLWHDDAGSVRRGVSACRGGAHEEEAGAHHSLVLLHHRGAGGGTDVANTFLKLAKGYSQVWG